MIPRQQATPIGWCLSATEDCIQKSIVVRAGRRFCKKSSTCFPYWEGMSVTFRQFAFINVIRNKRLYAAYFLSSLFTVMVFFTFAIFAFHPVFFDGSIRGEVLYGMAVAGGIIYVFSFFFVLYSMSAFLQSRKKEFGLLMTQG